MAEGCFRDGANEVHSPPFWGARNRDFYRYAHSHKNILRWILQKCGGEKSGERGHYVDYLAVKKYFLKAGGRHEKHSFQSVR